MTFALVLLALSLLIGIVGIVAASRDHDTRRPPTSHRVDQAFLPPAARL